MMPRRLNPIKVARVVKESAHFKKTLLSSSSSAKVKSDNTLITPTPTDEDKRTIIEQKSPDTSSQSPSKQNGDNLNKNLTPSQTTTTTTTNSKFFKQTRLTDFMESKKSTTSSKVEDKDLKDGTNLKRKHVYDSLEHCRAVRTRSATKQATTKVLNEKTEAKTSPDTNVTNTKTPQTIAAEREQQLEDEADTLDFVESLRSKSTSRSGKFHDTSLDGKPFNLKITTWNINGLRSWLQKRSGLKFLADDDADIYCFQEIKCGNSKIPGEIKDIPGYYTFWNGSDDGHSGVVCFSKKQPISVKNGIGIEIYDKEARVITLEFNKYYVINVYVPNSGRGLVRLDFRMKWDADFQNYLKQLDSIKPIIICGDLNVSHHEIDLANPKTNLKTAGFTIGERNNFTKLLDNVNLIDIFRHLNPERPECYTYWSYMKNAREKNIGWRLDYFLISSRWTKKICDCIIRSEVYGSDHCPVSLYISV